MTALRVDPAGRGLRGTLRVIGDKSISHRVLLLGALAEGRSELEGLSEGADVAHTAAAVEAFGVEVERRGATWALSGGRRRLHEPERVVEVGNSGTAIRLLAGWAAGVGGLSIFQGDASIARRPMQRIAEPLRAMGAAVDGRDGGRLPPLVVRGGQLHGIDYHLPVASAQVKGCILLAGLGADGPTTVREDVPTRAHTEELLRAFGGDVHAGEGRVTVHAGELQARRMVVPADPSQAAFWAVAASIVAGSDLLLEHVYVGPGRAGFVDVLRRMGADLTVEALDPATSTADLRVRSASLRATRIAGAEIPALIDEIPVLAVAAAVAEGVTEVADAAELRVKESDRTRTVSAALAALGVEVEARPDGLVVHGRPGGLRGGSVESAGDHRVAMSAAVAALGASGPVHIGGWEAVATSYPSFEEDLRRCLS